MTTAAPGVVTRIAPTPSGYLHPGNAVNVLLTAWRARAAGGRLLLRIDDFDTGRARPEYLDDIFRTLDWLDVSIDDGPTGPDDFLARWSMSTRVEQFRAARDRVRSRHPEAVFACRCSRTQLSSGRCTAGCARAGLALQPGRTALRMHVADSRPVRIGRDEATLPGGDHVLWRRDDLPAYQLGSVVADEALGVTALVRGVDLLESSALQLHLAGLLACPTFRDVDLRHHGLLTGPTGAKLSKSAGVQAHPMDRTGSLRRRVERWAEQLGAPIGVVRP